MTFHSAHFTLLAQDSKSHNEKNDCSVIAISAISGLPYSIVHTLFHQFGRRPRCGTQMRITHKVLNHLNFCSTNITHFYPPSSVRSITPLLPSQGRFLIETRSHLLAVVNGEVQDWSAMRKLYVRNILHVLSQDHPNSLTSSISQNQPLSPPLPRDQLLSPTSLTLSHPTIATQEIISALSETDEHLNLVLREKRLHTHTLTQIDRNRILATFRAKVVAEAVSHGINKSTAMVQVSKWCRQNEL